MNGVQQATGTNPAAKANGLAGIGGYEYKGNSATTPAAQAKTATPPSEKSGGTMADIAKMFSEAISQIVSAFMSVMTKMSGGKGAEASTDAKPAGESMKTEAAAEKDKADSGSSIFSAFSEYASNLTSAFNTLATKATDKAAGAMNKLA